MKSKSRSNPLVAGGIRRSKNSSGRSARQTVGLAMRMPSDEDLKGYPDDVSVVIMEGALAGMAMSVRGLRALNKAAREYANEIIFHKSRRKGL